MRHRQWSAAKGRFKYTSCYLSIYSGRFVRLVLISQLNMKFLYPISGLEVR